MKLVRSLITYNAQRTSYPLGNITYKNTLAVMGLLLVVAFNLWAFHRAL